MRAWVALLAATFTVAASLGCGSRPTPPTPSAPAAVVKRAPVVAVAKASVPSAAPLLAREAQVTYGSWKGFGPSGCAYLAPTDSVVANDGGFDAVFHFHAGQMADRDLRASGVRAVFVSCGFGLGTGPYAAAFADPSRFGRMIGALSKAVAREAGRPDVHVRRLALASWSAGFASIAKILSVPRYEAMTDAVVLFDSLHAGYDLQKRADVRQLEAFVRFADAAARGERLMVITHSAIVPPGYASSAEATRAVLTAIDVPIVGVTGDASDLGSATPMRLVARADAGNLHVRDFGGEGPADHFAHLHLVGQTLRSWLVPRWTTYTPVGE